MKVQEAKKNYKIWLDSDDGEFGITQNIGTIKWAIPPMWSIDPKYQTSLVYLKSFWFDNAEQTTKCFKLRLNGCSMPNNYSGGNTNRGTGDVFPRKGGLSNLIAVIPNSSYKGVSDSGGVSPEEDDYPAGSGMVFSGNVKDNGIYVGSTIVNDGNIEIILETEDYVKIQGEGKYIVELDVYLIENENGGCC